jgi:ADP-heptose:LPS heptosyltransferase/GT2 family glycosyltransferase
MADLSVIIPTYNTIAWLDMCLGSLDRCVGRDNMEVIVVANTSQTPVFKTILNHRVDQIVRHTQNLGAAAGFNAGALKANSDTLCFVHSDVVFPQKSLARLLEVYKKSRTEGACTVGAIPVTNYAGEHNLILNQAFLDSYTQKKPCNKSMPSVDELKTLLREFYDGEDHWEALDKFSDKIHAEYNQLSGLAPGFGHYCLMLDKKTFMDFGMFDVDFWPIGYFEKLFGEKLLQNCYEVHVHRGIYVHHNGNSTSDFYGFNYRDILQETETLYRSKLKQAASAQKEAVLTALKAPDKQEDTTLFIRHGGLGDIIMTLPLVKSYRVKYPERKVTYLVNPEHELFLKNFNFINQVITDDVKPSPENYDSVMASNKKYENLYGKVIDWTMYAELSPDLKTKSRIDIFKEKINWDVDFKFPKIQIPNSVVTQLMPSCEKLIVVAPSATCAARSWSIENACDFCAQIEGKYGKSMKMVLVDNVRREVASDSIVNLTGQLTVNDLIALIFKSDAVVSSDNGIFHLAALLDKPCLGLFGSIPPDLRRDAYTNKIETVFLKDMLPCIPCFDKGCESIPCLNKISYDTLIPKLELLLG